MSLTAYYPIHPATGAPNPEFLETLRDTYIITSNGFAANPALWDKTPSGFERTENKLLTTPHPATEKTLVMPDGIKIIHLFLGNSDKSIAASNANVKLNKLGEPLDVSNLPEKQRIAGLEAQGLKVGLYDHLEPEESFKALVDGQKTFNYRWLAHFKVGPGNILICGTDKCYHNGGRTFVYTIGNHATSYHTMNVGDDPRIEYEPL